MSHPPESHPAHRLRTLGARLARLARRYRVPRSDCEDCSQDALLALLVAQPDWSLDDSRTIAWLFGAARNKALDFHRHRQRHPSTSLEELGSFLVDEPVHPADRDLDRVGTLHEIASTAQDLLNRLPDLNRQIIIRRIQEDRTFSEIGAALGLTRQQVKARYRRALKLIRIRCDQWRDDALGGGGGGEDAGHPNEEIPPARDAEPGGSHP